MINRLRYLLVVLAVAMPGLGMSAPAGAQASDPAGFVSTLAQRAIPVLTRPELPERQREQEFRNLLHEGFDMTQLSRLVLGRYWNQASPAEQAEFVKLLERYLIQLYAARFADFQNVRLQVDGTRSEQGQALVRSTLVRPNGPPVGLDWRVENAGGRFTITDIVVEGVSMVITQRSEFASVIRQQGGQVAGLLQVLRQKTGS